MSKSPFLVFQNFISPLLCEQILDLTELYEPNLNRDGKPIKTVKRDQQVEEIVFEKMQSLIPTIENYFDVTYKGTDTFPVEWFPETSEGEPQCENSSYLRKKWVRTKDNDLTGVLFLSDFQDNIPFDTEFEVFGGKLEFPQWGFGFNPQRGTLIVYPSCPHFINVTTKINVGDLYQIRFHITTEAPLLFDAANFPGDYKTWFKDLS